MSRSVDIGFSKICNKKKDNKKRKSGAEKIEILSARYIFIIKLVTRFEVIYFYLIRDVV